MSLKFKIWFKATRPPAIVNTLFPIIFGQSLAYFSHQKFNISLFSILFLFSYFTQLLIVFWNDYADAEADLANTNYNIFSGGSRVLPNNLLLPKQLFIAGNIAAFMIILLGVMLTWAYRFWLIIPFIIVGISLIWAYSLPPIKLNYRGGGEFLQAIGCGIWLPVIGYYCQVASFAKMEWLLLIPFFLLHLMGAIATAIPDYSSDRLAIKRTIPVLLGIENAAKLLVIIGLIALILAFGIFKMNSWEIHAYESGTFGVIFFILTIAFLLKPKPKSTIKQILIFDILIVSIPFIFAVGMSFAFFQ